MVGFDKAFHDKLNMRDKKLFKSICRLSEPELDIALNKLGLTSFLARIKLVKPEKGFVKKVLSKR